MRRIVLLSLLAVIPASASGQQPIEIVGQRALGMGGAFVAVADDATAVFWNPAGLVHGQPYGATIEWNRLRFGNPDLPLVAGPSRRRSSLVSLGTWPVGLSYVRQDSTELIDGQAGGVEFSSLETRQYGLTLLQTVAEGVVVGTTLKYVRGSVVSGPAGGATVGAALDAVDDLDRSSSGAFDLDLGVMVDLARVRAGVVVKNLREPTFGAVAAPAITLKRQARLGLAVLPADGLTLAIDVDLNTVGLRDGLRRMFALGGESRLGTRLSVRAGVRWDLEGPRQPIASAGASVAVRSGLWLDGHVSRGTLDGDRGFGVALRAGY